MDSWITGSGMLRQWGNPEGAHTTSTQAKRQAKTRHWEEGGDQPQEANITRNTKYTFVPTLQCMAARIHYKKKS